MSKETKNVAAEVPAESTAMTVFNDDTGLASELQSRATSFCSMVCRTPAEKARLYNLMNAPEFTVKKFINKTILVKDVFIEKVTLVNKETGELEDANRIVLIDKDGKGYQATAKGVFSALKKLVQVYGAPTWDVPLPIIPIEISKSNDRNILTLTIAAD